MKYSYNKPLKDSQNIDPEESKTALVIASLFDRLDTQRASQLDDIKNVREAIYHSHSNPNEGWSKKIKLPEIYELSQTLRAHLWENIYSNPEGMFDVFGRDPVSQASAASQKAMLVNAFEDMKITKELDEAVNSFVETGEAIVFVGWETKTKLKRMKDPLASSGFRLEEEVLFDGAKVNVVKSENFVYDSGIKDFEKASKILRSYATLDEISSNKVYTLTEESQNTIKSELESRKSKDSQSSDKIELLEFWGDFTMSDGTLLRNWLITVANRTSVIRFEPNPYVMNPFVYASLIQDATTKRGISPLRVALVLNGISSDILNRQLDALALIMNPPYLAPKGSFSGEQEVSPGRIIEYESSLMPQAPVPLRFESALQGWEFIRFFSSEQESSSGIFKSMSGQYDGPKRTATEINYTAGAQSTRLNMSIDIINQRLIIPMVEKVAELISNFCFGVQSVFVLEKGKPTYIEVDDAVRQSSYSYRYGDRKATIERKLKFKELFEVVSSFAKIESVSASINWIECFKYALEQYGIENSENFLSGQSNDYV